MGTVHNFDFILGIINNEIKTINYPYKPASLFEPISYTLSIGGKRIRPALSLMSYNLYKEDVMTVIPVALGVELFHNFTLLHDDLMDRADVRRGKPTVHIKWNDNTAVLSGDAMLIEAYKMIAKTQEKYLPRVLSSFSEMATEICCGQQLDMEFEQRMDVTIAEYMEMIRLKTAVLLGCSLKCGAILADAPENDIENLYNFGVNIGLAFQLKDDLLDVYGDQKTFGKKIGGDILCNKKTFLLISALSEDSVHDELLKWINIRNFEENDKIKAVTAIYNQLDLKKKSEQLINDYYTKAIENLNRINVPPPRKKTLQELSEYLISRNL